MFRLDVVLGCFTTFAMLALLYTYCLYLYLLYLFNRA